jgi:voltage-gated potassium channel
LTPAFRSPNDSGVTDASQAAQPDDVTHHPAYQLFMLVLCLFALGIIAARTAMHLEPATAGILDLADRGVCVIFLLDFVHSFWRAPNKRRYFFRWGWLDLVSSIPMVSYARWGRAARIVRVFRLLRGLRATRILAAAILRRRAESAFLAATLLALLLIVFASIAILSVETAADSNIKTAEDAIWWAVSTITTVGYGDRYPTTSGGRFIAAILMFSGVGLFGTLSGFLAAWFVGPGEKTLESEIRGLRADIARLHERLDERSR